MYKATRFLLKSCLRSSVHLCTVRKQTNWTSICLNFRGLPWQRTSMQQNTWSARPLPRRGWKQFLTRLYARCPKPKPKKKPMCRLILTEQVTPMLDQMSRLHDKTNKKTCAPSEDADQPGHPPSLMSRRCPHEEALGPWLPIERTTKPLIRLRGCPGWSESSLGQMLFCWFCRAAAQININPPLACAGRII